MLRKREKPVWGQLLRQGQFRELFTQLRSEGLVNPAQRDVTLYQLEE